MRLCVPLGLLLTLATIARSQPLVAAETLAVSPSLLRTSLIVADVDRSIAFYALLGFRIESDNSNAREPKGNPFPLNAPSTGVRLAILVNANGQGGRVGLVGFTAPVPPVVRPASERVGRGDPVLVFDVPDAVAIHATLSARGARIIEAPYTYKSRRTDEKGRPLEGKVFHVFDPDGVLIELLEAPKPVAAP